MPTEITCRDTENGDTESQTIENDWLIVCDGDYYLHYVSAYANGTAVITVKRKETQVSAETADN